MAPERNGFKEVSIKRFSREKGDAGTVKHYKPWLTVSDMPSMGRVHRGFWRKNERVGH